MTTLPVPELLVIAGPTASGKTALALDVARRLEAEIVSADSQQVYRAFDVGTAKPSEEELGAVRHHLISVVDPMDRFSAGRYRELADAAIADIHRRGKRVLVVGGTGLYLRVLLHGVVDAPPADLGLRRQLEEEAALHGRERLYERLRVVDPETAEAISPRDLVRIVRALEIHTLTGEPASLHRRRHAFAPDRYPYRMFVLDPPRDDLYAAIDRRTRAMFDGGLLDEVKRLVELGYAEAPPMQSVGYKEAFALLQGLISREDAIAAAAQATRNYAKRQFTWFRKEPGARFVPPPYEEVRRVEP